MRLDAAGVERVHRDSAIRAGLQGNGAGGDTVGDGDIEHQQRGDVGCRHLDHEARHRGGGGYISPDQQRDPIERGLGQVTRYARAQRLVVMFDCFHRPLEGGQKLRGMEVQFRIVADLGQPTEAPVSASISSMLRSISCITRMTLSTEKVPMRLPIKLGVSLA